MSVAQERRTDPLDGPCPQCRYDSRQLAPSDAAVAALSLSRRWRELLSGVANQQPNGEALLHQSLDGGASAFDRAGLVTAAFRRSARHLAQVWGQHRPVLDDDDHDDALPPLTAMTRVDERLDALQSAAQHLAERIGAFDSDAWGRAGLRSGQPIGALQLAREAIHQGAHHLRCTRDGLAPLCTLPDENDDQ